MSAQLSPDGDFVIAGSMGDLLIFHTLSGAEWQLELQICGVFEFFRFVQRLDVCCSVEVLLSVS